MTEHGLPTGTIPLAGHAKPDGNGKSPVDGAVAQLARQLTEAGLAGLSGRERRVILHIATRRQVYGAGFCRKTVGHFCESCLGHLDVGA